MYGRDLRNAERHIRNAWIAGTISAIVTFIFSAIGAYSQTVQIKYGFDTWTLFDVALIAGLTFGIYKKSRFCALSLLIYFVLPKFSMAAYSGKFGHGIGALIFGYFFFQGTKATFQIHKHLAETGQKSKKKRGIIFYAGGGIVGLVIIAVGIVTILNVFAPPTEVIPGQLLNKKYSTYIREQKLIEKGEEIIYWYSDGFPDFKSGFYFFTKDKVIVYSKNRENPAIIVKFTSIDDMKFERDQSFLGVSRIILLLHDNNELYFPVSNEKGGDKKFYNTLIKNYSYAYYNRGRDYWDKGFFEKAIADFLRAAEQGLPRAQFSLGLIYRNGMKIPQNNSEAVRWYQKSATQGFPPAQYDLGFMYLRGEGVRLDSKKAASLWHDAAIQGYDPSQYGYGYLCAKGMGVSTDLEEAIKWYREAAGKGNIWAQYALGCMNDLGLGVTHNEVEANKYYAVVAKQDDYATALKEFLNSAKVGEDDAQFFIGNMYRLGHGVKQNDEESIVWLIKAAENGYAAAQFLLAIMHEKGQGVPQDIEAALKWYRMAAEQEISEAKKRLNLLEDR